MSFDDFDDSELAKWDPGFTEMAGRIVGPSPSSGSGQRCGVLNSCRRPAARWWCATIPAAR